jgi:hypothetical protein
VGADVGVGVACGGVEEEDDDADGGSLRFFLAAVASFMFLLARIGWDDIVEPVRVVVRKGNDDDADAVVRARALVTRTGFWWSLNVLRSSLSPQFFPPPYFFTVMFGLGI